MINEAMIEACERYGRTIFEHDASGHDYHHTLRVYHMAVRLAHEEGADVGVVSLAALLHDVDDPKLSPETADGLDRARVFLTEYEVDESEASAVLAAIREVSFSKNAGQAPTTREAACVRDADRLDAIGAIGVARTFAYGGAHGRPLHDPSGQDSGTTTAHFHDKLLLLKDLMCTESGRRIAEHRHNVTAAFLDEFLAEWDGLR